MYALDLSPSGAITGPRRIQHSSHHNAAAGLICQGELEVNTELEKSNGIPHSICDLLRTNKNLVVYLLEWKHSDTLLIF